MAKIVKSIKEKKWSCKKICESVSKIPNGNNGDYGEIIEAQRIKKVYKMKCCLVYSSFSLQDMEDYGFP